MKKILLSVLACLLVACTLMATACGTASSWKKPSLKTPGNVISDGGFVAETDNYLYVINGIGSSSEDNTFGAPVKGSLVAVDKATLNTDNVKAEVVVPKLLVATDYSAGLKISGGYAYYGSPNTEKNSSGEIARSEMTFMRTKLDGTQEKGDIFFTVDSNSAKYRFVESEGVVSIVYQDTEDSSIKVYNTADKKETVIAKTDAKNNTAVTLGDKTVYLSLDAITFADCESDVALFYTVTVYTEKYSEQAANDSSSYSRRTASYNLIYAVNGKGKAVLVADGSKDNVKYSINLVSGGYVFLTETPENLSAKTYAISLDTVMTENAVKTEIVNKDYVKSGIVIKGLDEIYYLDETSTDSSTGETTGTGNIIKTTLVGDESIVKEKVVLASNASTLLDVKTEGQKDYVYYYNKNGEIARIELKNADADEYRVSSGTVNTSWYTPEFLTVGEKEYVFYCDTTKIGSSYVWFTDLSTAVEEDTDDDDENDKFYFASVKVAGKMLDADKANAAVAAIEEIESVLEWTEVDGKRVVKSVEKARAVYNGLGDAKEHVAENYVTKLVNAEKAVAIGNKYYALKGVKKYDDITDATVKAKYESDYKAAVELRQSYYDEYGKSRWETIRNMLNDEIKSYMTDAEKVFDYDED